MAVGGWIERTEKRGVVWPRQYELAGSHFAAVRSFWIERDVDRETERETEGERERERGRGRHLLLLDRSMQLDRIWEERATKEEGMRKGRRHRMEKWGKVFPSS